MKLTFSEIVEIVEYSNNAPIYKNGLCFVWSGVTKDDTVNFMMWLRRYCAKNANLSVMLVVSTHKSDINLCQKTIKNGKKGRPKVVVYGKAAKPHIHMIIVNESADTEIESVKIDITSYCQRRRKKHSHLRQQRMKPLTGMNIVNYMSRQANEEHTFGDYDFSYFKDDRYSDFQ